MCLYIRIVLYYMLYAICKLLYYYVIYIYSFYLFSIAQVAQLVSASVLCTEG